MASKTVKQLIMVGNREYPCKKKTIWRTVTAQWCQQANVHKEEALDCFCT